MNVLFTVRRIFQSLLWCIIFGLELSAEHFKFSKNRKPEETVYILCDCSQAIEITVKKVVFTIRFRQALLESAPSELNVKIVLAWIPGHQGIALNEFADL